MPVLCMFYGIIVRMYRELGGKHNIPHIHVEYSGQEAVIGLDGTVLEGKLPKSQMKLVDAWMEIHKDDLAANWTLLSNNVDFETSVRKASAFVQRCIEITEEFECPRTDGVCFEEVLNELKA